MHGDSRFEVWAKTWARMACIAAAGGLAACGGGGGGGHGGGGVVLPPPGQTRLACDDTMKSGFKPDANTSVLLVKSFKTGDRAAAVGHAATPSTPAATNDVCVVKLLVGPGNPGPADAPSTSPGIGIEVWLPGEANWNEPHPRERRRRLGRRRADLTDRAGRRPGGAAGALVADDRRWSKARFRRQHRHRPRQPANGGSFAMKPDGTINTALWNDFAQRGIHEMAVKTKALTQPTTASAARYAYWDGFSTGGRQGHMEAQANPADFDGILAGAPAHQLDASSSPPSCTRRSSTSATSAACR